MIKTTDGDVGQLMSVMLVSQQEIAESISENGLAVVKSQHSPNQPIWVLTRLEPNKMTALGDLLVLEIEGLEEAMKNGEEQGM